MVRQKKKPLVSVVIINYNYGRFIDDAIESVLNQTYDNIEIIVIDDGSTDNSKAVIDSYIKNNDNIRVIYRENMGVVKTRNQAIEETKGEYYIQLDADDYIDKNYIEETLKIALEKDVDLVYTDFQQFDQSDTRSNFPSEYNFEWLKNQNFIHISCLIKRSAVGEVRFDESLSGKTHEDWDFFIELGTRGMRAAKCSETVLNYRIHGGGRNIDKSDLVEDNDLGLKNQIRYIDVYSYIISKHNQGGERRDFEYLIGPVFGSWFSSLYNQYLHTKNESSRIENEVTELKREMQQLTQSKSYRVGEAIAKPVRRIRSILRKKS